MSREQYNIELGQWISDQRAKLGITQAQLAEAIGVSAAAVSAWEKGRGTMLAYSRSRLSSYFKRTSRRRAMTADEMPQPANAAVIGGHRG